MKLSKSLVVLLGIALLVVITGCSTTSPVEVAPTPNIEATVDAKLTEERASQPTAIPMPTVSAFTYNESGIAYGKLDQIQRAIEDFDKAIQVDPNYAKAYNNRGYAYASLGQYQQAMKDYYTAIQLDPTDAEAYRNRGGAYSRLGDYQRAIADYDKAIQLDPDYALAYFGRSVAYTGLGEDPKAEVRPGSDPKAYANAKSDADKAKACSLNKRFCR